MIDDTDLYKRLAWAACASLVVAAMGCGTDNSGDDDGPPIEQGPFSTRVSRSSTIAISEDNSHVAMVNPDDGSLSVFATSDNSRTAKLTTGNNPSSVVIAADNKTAYVANRADGTVVRIVGIDGGTPSITATTDVGAEPAALALSPSGKRLFVAEFAGSRVSVINTATMAIESSIPIDRPRALAVTNNADTSDTDEQLVVSQFFGVPVPGKEARDDGRTGRLATFSVGSLTKTVDINLAPIDSGFHVGGVATNPTVTTSPNQLAAVAVAANRVYVTSVSASPAGPTRFDNNVFPVVYVADLATGAEIRDESGTANLALKVTEAIPTPSPASPRFIPGDLSDIAFLGNTQVAYVVGKAGDVMLRLAYGSKLEIGSTQNKEIDLAGNATIGSCQGPIGLVVSQDLGRAYVNCWVTRRLGLVDLSVQALTQTFEASSSPPSGNAVELSVQKGKRFFFTGRARWSNGLANGAKGGEGWSSCASCHPDGLSDNITWIFGTGPRQTTSMDGSFSHGSGPQKQRMFNWTAVNDEMHDFEANTRGVSGGVGAIVTAADPTTECNQLDKEGLLPVTLNGPLLASNKGLADDITRVACVHKDWDDINAYVKTIAPVHTSKLADAQAITRGKQLFVEGGCAKCHGGPGWTVSSRPYEPANDGAVTFGTQAFARPAFLAAFMYDVARPKISNQPAIAADATGPGDAEVPVLQLACALRNVGTFGVPNDVAATDALEKRANGVPRAQGRAGYNVPSLYGLALGAPYLHHGQAATLADLFSDAKWNFHTSAGNANFSLTLAQSGKLADLSAFLFSIDAATPEIALPTDPASGQSFDACLQ